MISSRSMEINCDKRNLSWNVLDDAHATIGVGITRIFGTR